MMPYPGHDNVVVVLPRLVSLAELVGCDLVVLHPPKTTSREGLLWQRFVEGLLHQRSKTKVRISLENAGIFRESDIHYILHGLRGLRVFAEQYDLPLTFDTAHAGSSTYELLEAYSLLDGRVVNIHFSDFSQRCVIPDWPPLHTLFRHHQMPGEGELPLSEFGHELLSSGYRGILTLEVSPTALKAWSPSLAREGLANAVGFVRQLLNR
jgi:sugar phosphate isomerase/epimerase